MEFFFGVFDNDKEKSLKYLREEEVQIEAIFEELEEDLKWADKDSLIWRTKYNIGDKFTDYLSKWTNSMTFFHFSGHHGEETMHLVNQKINDAAAIEILNKSKKLKCVFLNGCDTKAIAEKLTNVPIVIGTKQSVGDEMAMKIAVKFYQLLCGNKNLNDFRDEQKIKDYFNQALNFDKLPASEKKVDEAVEEEQRGVKAKSKKSNDPTDFYQLTINLDAEDFDKRVRYLSDIGSFPANECFEELIEEWKENNEFTKTEETDCGDAFYRYFPKPISSNLHKICPSQDDNPAKQLGVERFKELQKLYLNFLLFFKYCGFSLIWEGLRGENPITIDQDLKDKMRAHLLMDWYELKPNKLAEGIDLLVNMLAEVKSLGIADEFVKESLKCFKKQQNKLKKFSELFCLKAKNVEQSHFFKAEEFLTLFVNEWGFLKNYEFTSILESRYSRYIVQEDTFTYQVRKFPKDRGGFDVQETIPISKQLYDVFSIQLIEKGKDIKDANSTREIINLSPFYVDSNIKENQGTMSSVDKAILNCLATYLYEDEFNVTQEILYYRVIEDEKQERLKWKNIKAKEQDKDNHFFASTKLYTHINAFYQIIK